MCLQSAVFDNFSLEISYFWQSSSWYTIFWQINHCIFLFLTELILVYTIPERVLAKYSWSVPIPGRVCNYIHSWHSKY